MLIHNANVTGSMHLNGMDMSTITGSVSTIVFNQFSSSTNEFTGSTNTRIINLDNASGKKDVLAVPHKFPYNQIQLYVL
jgi:hypothetical protein